MLKPTSSASYASSRRLRRAAASVSVISTTLCTCWAVGVGARQAKPTPSKIPAAKTSAPPGAVSKNAPAKSLPTTQDTTQPTYGNIDFTDFLADEQTNTGTAHKFVYTTGDTVISGDNVRVDQNKKILDADSNLVLDDPKHHITGDKSHVDRKINKLTVTGRVVLTLKPEAAAANADPNASLDDAKKQGAIVTCDEIESFYKRKFNILHGHLIFKQHILRANKKPLDRTGTAEHAEYDGKKEILVLFPPVHYEDSDESKYDSDKDNVIIHTQTGKETVSGKQSHVKVRVEETDDNEENPLPNSSPAPPTKSDKSEVKPDETKKADDAKKPDEPKKDTGAKDTGKPNTTK